MIEELMREWIYLKSDLDHLRSEKETIELEIGQKSKKIDEVSSS